MAIYEIARLNIKIDPLYEETRARLEPFLSESGDCDFEASVTRGEVEEYMKETNAGFPPHMCEGPLILTNICKRVLAEYDGFFFHSSCLELDGEGYMFTALSGTGKSTHTANWRRVFGDRVKMINDDKPIIRKIDGRFYVCSTPWMGKSDIGCNAIAPIKAVYVLTRGGTNTAEHVSPGTVFKQLLEATLLPKSKDSMAKLLELYNGLFSQVQLIRLSCNKDVESARVAYAAANTEEAK